jgi:hypothetical protein
LFIVLTNDVFFLGNQSFFKSTWFEDESSWGNSQVTSTFELALDVRDTLNHVIGSNNPKDLWVELQCDANNYKTLQVCTNYLFQFDNQ